MSHTSPQPAPDLRTLERLMGSWQVSGEATGQVRYEWAEGGSFLLQHFDLLHGGRPDRGMEVIGHLHPFGGQPSPDIHTRIYSFTDGLTLDYVYEREGDTLTIWGGQRGSPAFYRGKFSRDGWQWPGGGDTANMTRQSAQ